MNRALIFFLSFCCFPCFRAQFDNPVLLSSNFETDAITYVTDMDMDGLNDILRVNSAIMYYKNLDNGAFGMPQIISHSQNDWYMVVPGDLDSDGDCDLLYRTAIGFGWKKNNGTGAFGVIIQLQNIPAVINLLVMEDLDQDGDQDILITTENNDILWYANSGTESFTAQGAVSGSVLNNRRVFVEDTDNDGDNDVLSVNWGTVELYRNDGNQNFAAAEVLLTGIDSGKSYYKDINADGEKDLIFAQYSTQKVVWHPAQNDGFLSEQLIVENLSDLNEVNFADANSDGNTDVFVSNFNSGQLLTFIYAGNDSFNNTGMITVSNGTFHLSTGDLNNDAIDDLVSSGQGGDFPNFGDGAGNFVTGDQIVRFPYLVNKVEALDIDGDGDTDIVSSASDEHFSLFRNLGSGLFTGPEPLMDDPIFIGAASFQYGDIDGDGLADITALNGSLSAVRVVWGKNLGSGNYAAPTYITSFQNCSHALQCDLDNDGDRDLLLANAANVGLCWLENDGNAVFAAPQIIESDGLPPVNSLFETTDLDNDGDQDILFASYLGNKVGWYENTGNALFDAPQLISQSVGPNKLNVVDFNNDGFKDVLCGFANDAKLAWFKNTGGNGFGQEQIITSEAGAATFFSTATADINGDGYQDIVAGNYTDNRVVRFMNNGDGTFSIPLTVIYSINNPETNCLADLNGDLKPDLITGSNDYDVTYSINLFAVGLTENSAVDFTVFPNPFTNEFTISLPTKPSQTYAVSLVDLQGRIVYEQTGITESTVSINIAESSRGLLLLRITDSVTGNSSVSKVVQK